MEKLQDDKRDKIQKPDDIFVSRLEGGVRKYPSFRISYFFFCSPIRPALETCSKTSVSFIPPFCPRLNKNDRETAGEQFVDSIGSPPDGGTLPTGNIERFLK